MTEVSVKAKLWGLIALMLLLIIALGAVGFVTLDRGAATLKELIMEDEAFLEASSQLHLKIIQLRRYEKDYFLNIGRPDEQERYLKKFQEIDAQVSPLLAELTALARTDVHLTTAQQEKVAGLAELYASYRSGFYDTSRRLRAEPRLTPQQANALMAQYKTNIPVLEDDLVAVAAVGDEMVKSVSARAIHRGQEARLLIALTVLAAIVLAGVLGAALCRSIYRAIFREGLRRMAHRV
jgi:methyl-accepting chemotaxis protein